MADHAAPGLSSAVHLPSTWAQRPGQGYQARIALSKDYRHGGLDQAAFRAAMQRILAPMLTAEARYYGPDPYVNARLFDDAPSESLNGAAGPV